MGTRQAPAAPDAAALDSLDPFAFDDDLPGEAGPDEEDEDDSVDEDDPPDDELSDDDDVEDDVDDGVDPEPSPDVEEAEAPLSTLDDESRESLR